MSSYFIESQFFMTETKESDRSNSKTASEDGISDYYFSPSFISKPKDLPSNPEPYQTKKKYLSKLKAKVTSK